ncbi:MAG: type I DNA topoisomerase [Candidatus Saccharimonas sp.]
MSNLVIVESPAKAKTIEKYLGKDFHVLSSIGHIRSIAKKTKDGTPPIDVDNGFKTTYEIDPEKKKVIAELKRGVKKAGPANVWLATDEDREGEAIAWHLCEVLGLDPKTTKRIVFHEITKDAITHAVANPRTIDMKLVEAQQARQILDRIVGFELSPVVWQKVPGGKSAGRVQSPAVRLLVEREQEIAKFEGNSQFKVTALFYHDNQEFKAELNERFDTEAAARAFLESLLGAQFSVARVTKSPSTRNPGAPFTTSTLQQEANSKLGFGSKATMTSAQKLYQAGKITYMRTDSVNLSGQAIAAAAEHIKRLYGPEYSTVRKFKTKAAGAQEAHEAIRPTDMSLETASNNEYDQKLYDLIRRRTLASQMSPAKLEKTVVTITISTGKKVFEAKGEVIVFDGFLRVYGASKEELLPALTSGDVLNASQIEARQVFARPPARYTEGSLVKKLEDLGIGRPSTYATIIDTVQTRGYVERGEGEGEPRDVIVLKLEDIVRVGNNATSSDEGSAFPAEARQERKLDQLASRRPETGDGGVVDGHVVTREVVQEKTGSTKGKLIPTPSGELIAGFLGDHFGQVVDYDFTANVEQEFDRIADDKLPRNTMLQSFYEPFHKLIENSGGIDRSKVGANREVGTDPKSGKPIFARFGRFGPMLQLGSQDDTDKPQFAPLPAGAKIETVTLEQALEAFKLPRTIGETKDGKVIKAAIGRFGPFIQIGTKTKTTTPLYVSLKEDDPHDVTLARALELYDAKLKAEAEKNIADFGDGIKVLNGRFGPYITDGKKNAKIPKDTDPKSITHEQAKELIAEAPAKGKTRRPPRRKSSK